MGTPYASSMTNTLTKEEYEDIIFPIKHQRCLYCNHELKLPFRMEAPICVTCFIKYDAPFKLD